MAHCKVRLREEKGIDGIHRAGGGGNPFERFGARKNPTLAVDSRRALLDAYAKRYGMMLSLEYQVSETAMSWILGRHKRRRAEFAGLGEVVSLLDAGARQEPKRLGGDPFLFEDPGGAPRKTSDAHQSPM